MQPEKAKALRANLEAAIQGSLREIERAHPGEHLFGYALCTDDELRTVFHVACTREHLDVHPEYVDLAYVPNDWPYYEGATLFDAAVDLVKAEYAAAQGQQEFARHVAETFGIFVAALRRSKDQGLFASDVLLLVTSTDPGPLLETMACRAAQSLNAADLFERWRVAMGLPAPT